MKLPIIVMWKIKKERREYIYNIYWLLRPQPVAYKFLATLQKKPDGYGSFLFPSCRDHLYGNRMETGGPVVIFVSTISISCSDNVFFCVRNLMSSVRHHFISWTPFYISILLWYYYYFNIIIIIIIIILVLLVFNIN